jgi:polar amino acid transport system permease protein
MTLWLATISILIGLALGLVTAIGRRSQFFAVRGSAAVYIEVIRNTPFLVQAFFIFFGLPSIGLTLSPQQAAVLALSLNSGAFAAEVIRGGIDAVPKGQFEAGAALGLGPLQVLRFIVIKPALRTIFPALSGQFVLVLLTTSIVSSISATELTSVAEQIDSTTYRSFEVYVVTTLLYLGMSLILSTILKSIDRACFSYPVR